VTPCTYFSWNGVGSYAYERDYRVESGDVIANIGDECGQFHFGSTVVLIFEAQDFHFDIHPGFQSSFLSSFSCNINTI
jgi:phosphatidylserine decarboxylase